MKEISLEIAEDDLGCFCSSLIIIPTIFHLGRRVTLRPQVCCGVGGLLWIFHLDLIQMQEKRGTDNRFVR